MPAAVETAVFANTPAWHGLGTVIDTEGEKGISVPVALQESGLDWMVEKVPVLGFALGKGAKDHKEFRAKVKADTPLSYGDLEWVPGKYNVQRQTDGRILGTVGETWQPVQNADGFSLLDDVIQEAGGRCWIEAAGALDGGGRVWILAHIDEGLQIAGERYVSYLLFSNGHNGRMSVTAAALDLRVVCANTLDWGLKEATDSGRIVRVRHTVKAAERIKEAHAILGMRSRRAEELAMQGEWLVEQKMSDGAFETFLEALMPVPEGQEGKPADTMIRSRREQVQRIYLEAANLTPVRGTRWGALQAVLEYADHKRSFKTPESQLKAQWGITRADIKQQAFNMLYNGPVLATA